MFSAKFILFVSMAVAGSSVAAAPNFYKRDGPSPALAAREPQFSVNIPNNIPVSGSFPNGITITPQTPSGSIVTGNRNSTLFGQFGFKRDDATPALAAREPQFSVNIPNNIPVSGAFPNGITITPGTPSGSIVTGARNSTLFGQFGFKRDDATPALAARSPQFSVNIPNNIPVSGSFPNGITITPGTPSGSIVTSTRNGTFPFNLFGRDDDPRLALSPVFKIAPEDDTVFAAHPLPVGTGSIDARDNATPVLAAREPQFSVNIPNTIPVSGSFPNGINITPGTPSGSIVTGNRNSTLFGQLGFKREDATPALAAREPQFSVNIPNNIPVSGNFPNGINITPQTPSGSIVTSSRNSTFPFNLFGRDE